MTALRTELLQPLWRGGILNRSTSLPEGNPLITDADMKRMHRDQFHGSPTECAILHASIQCASPDSRQDLLKQWRTVFEIPFNSANKWMLTVHQRVSGGNFLVVMKGAPDRLFPLCSTNDDGKGDAGKIQDRIDKAAFR